MTERWLSLLTATRVLGAVVAIVLLSVHRVTAHDALLIAVTAGWTAASLLALRHPVVRERPAAWLVDAAAGLALVWGSGDWRSPFYVFALTTLVLPATSLPFRPALVWGAGFSASYLVVAVLTERLPPETLETTIRLETAATHVMVPLVVTLALAYASELVRRLRAERERSERLAVQAERQRIAWELHDSAKQRVHAAHLVLSAVGGAEGEQRGRLVDQALAELRAAAVDMETSVAELRAPLDGRPVDMLLRERARELAHASPAEIEVAGSLPALPPLVAAHTFRIAAEALTNAVRHADARHIRVQLGSAQGCASVSVTDDGDGMPETSRPGAHGIRAMRGRAETIGAQLAINTNGTGRGTSVELLVPLQRKGALE